MFDKEMPGIIPRSKSLVVCNQKSEKPSMYKVVIYPDDYTSPDFIRNILTDEFRKTAKLAFDMSIVFRRRGRLFAGVFTREAAEEKAGFVAELARESQHPLLVTFERV